MKKTVKIILPIMVLTVFFFSNFNHVAAVGPTPPSRQGYSSSVYFEAVTYDFDESGGTGSGIGRYSKVQRVSIRYTDLASGVVLLTPNWDSSVTSSIKQLVTSNIRCFDCTVTYSNDKFVIRPAGTMVCTFEVLYPNYATSALSFNITPYFTFDKNSFDESGLLGYEVPVYDRIVHSDLSALYTETHAINTVVATLGTKMDNIASDVDDIANYNQNIEHYTAGIRNDTDTIVSLLSQNNQSQQQHQQVQDKIDDLGGTTTNIVTQGNALGNLEDQVLNNFDSAMQNVNTTSLTSLLSSNTFVNSANWLGTQMTNIVQGSGTSLIEWTFIFPLIIGLVLLLIGRLR